MRTEAELEQLRADIAAQDRERQEAGQIRAEIERLTAENAKFRGCLEYIGEPVRELLGGTVPASEAHIRAAAARDVLDSSKP